MRFQCREYTTDPWDDALSYRFKLSIIGRWDENHCQESVAPPHELTHPDGDISFYLTYTIDCNQPFSEINSFILTSANSECVIRSYVLYDLDGNIHPSLSVTNT